MTGEQLRERRLALGLSQHDLCLLLGVTVQTVSMWERGKLGIRHPRTLALALDALEADNRAAEATAS